MSDVMKDLYAEYHKLLDYQKFIESDLNYSKLQYHFNLLDQLDVIESSSISIFDLFKRDHVYFSKKFESIFGWDLDEAHREGAAYANRKVHPDDVVPMFKAGNHFLKFAFSLPVESRKDFKVIHEYRMRWKNMQYVRVVEQLLTLETDKHGNIWLALCMMDLSPEQNNDAPYAGRIVNYRTGEVFVFNSEEKNSAVPAQLTKRETEILQKIAEGKTSKEIAGKLFISVHTVNTHRQRILEKLEVESSIAAIQYAREYGLLE